MKKNHSGFKALSLLVVAIAVSLFVFKDSVFAETMTGQVLSVNPQQRSVTVEKISPAQQAGNEVTIHLKEATALNGFNDIQELEAGDEISLDASRQFFFGPWEATQISRQTEAEAETAAKLDQDLSGEQKTAAPVEVKTETQENPADTPGIAEDESSPSIEPKEKAGSLPTGQELMERQSAAQAPESPVSPAAAS